MAWFATSSISEEYAMKRSIFYLLLPCYVLGCSASGGSQEKPDGVVEDDLSSADVDGGGEVVGEDGDGLWEDTDGGNEEIAGWTCSSNDDCSGKLPDLAICMTAWCDLSDGQCKPQPVSGDVGCDDGDSCTSGDRCKDGKCVSGAEICQCREDGDCAAFEDNNLCNGTLICIANNCIVSEPTVVKCEEPSSSCFVMVCDSATGLCSEIEAEAGVGCNDGDPCTVEDSCLAGVCSGVPMVCDDGDACTEGDYCDEGQCEAGAWVCAPKCGDGVCGEGESCESCPGDCGQCPHCGDGQCQEWETCSNCPGDCGSCPVVCGDGVCEGGESCSVCPGDCGECQPVCGDGVCDSVEDCVSCPVDCPVCGPACGDGVCEGSEECSSCPADCGACGAECGDGACTHDEDCETCPGDCPVCEPKLSCLAIIGCSMDCDDEWCVFDCMSIQPNEAQLLFIYMTQCIETNCVEVTQACFSQAVEGPCKQQYEACGKCDTSCAMLECGPNGCGGSCGQCEAGKLCSPEGVCVDGECGDSVCDEAAGEDCGSCPLDCGQCATYTCGMAVSCAGSCGDKQCALNCGVGLEGAELQAFDGLLACLTDACGPELEGDCVGAAMGGPCSDEYALCVG